MVDNKARKIKAEISELERELDRIKGRRGVCSQCGEEGDYANWIDDKPKICLECWNKNTIAKAREKLVHLIGLKVEDVIISSGCYPFQGLKLEGGYEIEVESNREGDAYLTGGIPELIP